MVGLRIALGAHWVQVVMIRTSWDIQSNAILAAWLNANWCIYWRLKPVDERSVYSEPDASSPLFLFLPSVPDGLESPVWFPRMSILFIPPQIPSESGNSDGICRNWPEFRNSGGIRRNVPESTGICPNLEGFTIKGIILPLGMTYIRAFHHFRSFFLTYLLINLI